jgi:hypothetical protein
MTVRQAMQMIFWCTICAACGGDDGSESESESEGEDDCDTLPFVGNCTLGAATECQEHELGSQAALDKEEKGCGTLGGAWADGVCTSIPSVAGGCQHTMTCAIYTQWYSSVSINTPEIEAQAVMMCKLSGGTWIDM